MVSIWYLIGTLSVGAVPVSEKLSGLLLLYLLGINVAAVHHLLVDPGLSATYRIFNTTTLFRGDRRQHDPRYFQSPPLSR